MTPADLYAAAGRALTELARAESASAKAAASCQRSERLFTKTRRGFRHESGFASALSRVTTANARWARAAEHRDRCIGLACAAIRAAGLEPRS